jgi:hypothetical protein
VILFCQKYKGFSKCIKGIFFKQFLFIFILYKLLSPNQMDGRDCCGQDGHLDTHIDQIDVCHNFMSYASYDLKCHIMTNDVYDIEI